MINIVELINFFKNGNGYITTKELIKLGINKSRIPYLINQDIIFKVAHGLYLDCNKLADEYFILQHQYPNIIFSNNSAFFLLNLSNRIPSKVEYTITREMRVRFDGECFYCSKNIFKLGLIEIITSYGNKVKCYNAERSICDVIKYNNMELELKNRIIHNYFNSKEKNIKLLLDYSLILNVYNEVNTLVEVMMKW